jgi:hypothetical protein
MHKTTSTGAGAVRYDGGEHVWRIHLRGEDQRLTWI